MDYGFSLEHAIESTHTRSLQFAILQHTWFRNLEECHAIEINGSETTEELMERLL